MGTRPARRRVAEGPGVRRKVDLVEHENHGTVDEVGQNQMIVIRKRPVRLHYEKQEVGRCGTLDALANTDSLHGFVRAAQTRRVPQDYRQSIDLNTSPRSRRGWCRVRGDNGALAARAAGSSGWIFRRSGGLRWRLFSPSRQSRPASNDAPSCGFDRRSRAGHPSPKAAQIDGSPHHRGSRFRLRSGPGSRKQFSRTCSISPRSVPSSWRREPCERAFRAGVDEVHHRFGLGEVDAAVQKGPPGELARARPGSHRSAAPPAGWPRRRRGEPWEWISTTSSRV